MADDYRDGGTRREGDHGADGYTRREGSGVNGGTRREGTPAGTGGAPWDSPDRGTRLEDRYGQLWSGGHHASRDTFTRGLPPELAMRFAVVEELAAGAEADVVIVDEMTSGRRLVLKLYRRGVVPDEEAVGRLAGANREHVVEVADRGRAGGCWFEVLEYCPHGSLRTLMDAGRAPTVPDVVAEAGSALAHVHQLGLVHRDMKPENILIRTVWPLDVVLGDFGLVRAVDASVRWTRAWGTPAYSPPEFEGGEVSAAWDWWSLGMIVAELAGGRHPFQLPDGSMMNDQQIRSALAQRAVDLSAVADDRVRLLCQGLLTRDRRHRWGYEQVTEWLAGGSPRVFADAAEAPGRARRVFFAGQEYGSLAELAAGFQQHWAEGMRRLYLERDATLVDELERMLRHRHRDEALRLMTPVSRGAEAPRRYANLLAEMDPELEPEYDGIRLTRKGLEAAALQVVSAGGDHDAARVLDEVRANDVLISWRDLRGMEHGPATQQRWAAAIADFTAEAGSLRSGDYQPGKADRAYASAWLLLCILAPDHYDRELSSLIAGLDTRAAGQQRWWSDLRGAPRPTPVSLVLTRLTEPLATEQTHRQEETEKARKRAEEQRQAAAQEEQRRRRREERDRRAARQRRVDRNWLIFAIVLIATFGAPYGLGKLWYAHLSHVSVLPPPDIRALPTGASFVPEWLFGGMVILGLLGLIMLRPRWTGRAPGILAGVLLVGVSLAAPAAADKALTSYNQAGKTRYATGPVPISEFSAPPYNGTCGDYGTSDQPVGTGYMRWVLTDANGNAGCAALVAYDGWRQVWQHQLDGTSEWWASLYMYGNTVATEKDTEGKPNVLEGFDASNGHLRWVFSCGDGDPNDVSNTTYGTSKITVTCDRGQVNVNPQTGKQIS